MALIADCIRLAGAYPAGVLLYRILWFDQRPKLRRDDGFWIVNSNSKWQDEIAGTSKQLKKAMADLKKAGLISSELYMFRGKNHAFIKVTAKTREALEGPIGKSLGGPIGKSLEGPLIEGGSSKGSSEGSSISEASLAPALAGTDQTAQFSPEETDEMKIPKSIKELLHHPEPSNTLAGNWKQLVAAQEKTFVPALTQKQRGQFNHFEKKCPPGSALKVMTATIQNWTFFANTVKSDKGVYSVPGVPDIGFLTMHADVAIKLALKVKPLQSTASKKEPEKPVDTTHPLMALNVKPEDEVLTGEAAINFMLELSNAPDDEDE